MDQEKRLTGPLYPDVELQAVPHRYQHVRFPYALERQRKIPITPPRIPPTQSPITQPTAIPTGTIVAEGTRNPPFSPGSSDPLPCPSDLLLPMV